MSERPPGDGPRVSLDPLDFTEPYEPYLPVTTPHDPSVGSSHGTTKTAHTNPAHYTTLGAAVQVPPQPRADRSANRELSHLPQPTFSTTSSSLPAPAPS
ncbi:MAG: hypothetical protein SGPRY_009946, partial [Prymnesium sp.]